MWHRLPRSVQETIISKKLRFFVIDAGKVAHSLGTGGRINTVMQPCFFALSKVLPLDKAVAAMKQAIVKTHGKGGEAVVQRNCAAVDQSLGHLHEVKVTAGAPSGSDRRPAVPDEAPEFVRRVTSLMAATCRRGPTRSTLTAAAPPGPTRCSRSRFASRGSTRTSSSNKVPTATRGTSATSRG